MSDDDDDNDDPTGFELMNWPPERGPINPYIGRDTYIPNIRRLPVKGPLPPSPLVGETGLHGKFDCVYRVALVESLSAQTAETFVNVVDPGENYSPTFLDLRRQDEDLLPEFVFDLVSIPTTKGNITFSNPKRLRIGPTTVETVYPKVPGRKQRKNEISKHVSAGLILWLVAKELKKLCAVDGLDEDYQNLYFESIVIDSEDRAYLEFKARKSPSQEVEFVLPEITREIITPKKRFQRIKHRPSPTPAALEKSKLPGEWFGMYSINSVPLLTLKQAHELLWLSTRHFEEIREGHPEFQRYLDRETKRKARQQEMISEEEGEREEDSLFAQELQSKLQDFLAEQGIESELLDAEENEQEDEENDEKVFRKLLVDSSFDRWLKAKNNAAPTLVIDINYPINKTVRLTIPPVKIVLNNQEMLRMSPGYLMWVLSKEYQRIYAHHEEFEVWGHDINDLVFEGFAIEDNGETEMMIGS